MGILAFFIVFLIVAFAKVPIGFAILSGGLAAYLVENLNLMIWPSALFAGLDSFPLLAIPAFFLAGELMASGGISEALVDWIHAIIGRVRGSLGAVMVVTSAVFGAITGSSVATVSAIGNILKEPMLKKGYSKEYFTALASSSGILGTLIPPSIPGIMYALIAEQKVTDVWMSTLLPGIVLTIMYCIVNYLVFGRHAEKDETKFDFKTWGKEIGRTTPKALVALIMPVIIFGGVYGGAFTATEAGAVAVCYGILAGWVIYPLLFKLKPENGLYTTFSKSALTSLTIALAISTAAIISRMIALSGIAAKIAGFMLNVTDSAAVFLLCTNILLILVGMFLETNAGILLFAPILIPVAQAYGIDLIHFGAILLLNLEIGLMTPPFAGNIFVACKLTGVPMDKMLPKMIPFFGACLPVLLITTYWPSFSLFIPHLLHG